MVDVIFKAPAQIKARALYIGQRLNLKAFEGAARLAASPLVLQAGAQGCAVLFKYGAVVLFNLGPVEEVSFLAALNSLVTDPLETPESDITDIVVDPTQPEQVEERFIRLREGTVDYVQIMADIMAKSVTLSYYESQVAVSFDRIEPMADELQRKGRSGQKSRELLRHIGQTLLIQSKMIGRVEVEDKPDLLWDRPDLERLYIQMESEYELQERIAALQHKLDLINQTAETLQGLLQDRRSLHVEWYVLILIVFEILLSLHDKFFR